MPVPLGPLTTSEWPPVTNSGPRALPSSESRTADWKVKSYSSMVLRNGKRARRTQRWMGDFLGQEDGQVVAVGEVLRLGPRGEVGIEAADGGQMQPPQERVEVDRRRGAHALTSAGLVANQVRTYSAPMAPWRTPQAKASCSAAAP